MVAAGLRGNLVRKQRYLHPQPVPCTRICVRRSASRDSVKWRTEGMDGTDQGAVGRRAGPLGHRRSLKPHRRRSETVSVRVRYCARPKRTECATTFAGSADFRSDPASWTTPASASLAEKPVQKSGANALLAAGCCLENMRWPDFLEQRACRVGA